MVTGLATGPGGGGGYMLLVKNAPPTVPPPPPPMRLLTGLLTAPGWDCGGGGGCVLCASWQTSVTKSEKVSWPFSWYFASVVGLCGPLYTVEVVAVVPTPAAEVQTTGL